MKQLSVQLKMLSQKTVDLLGMKDLLQKNNYWENPPSPVLRDEDLAEDPDDQPDEPISDCGRTQILVELLQENNLGEDPSVIESGIAKLSQAGLIESDLKDRLMDLHRSSFKKFPGSSMPLFEKLDVPLKDETPKKTQSSSQSQSLWKNGVH